MIKAFIPYFRRLAILRRQEGVSMIIVMGVMLVTSLLVVAAFTSANGEVHLTNTDRAEKKAYYAAEAGLEDYEYHLTQDGNYLSYCTSPTPENKALNEYYKEGTTTPLAASELQTAEVPEIEKTSSEEKYAIQLLPAESNKEEHPTCNKNHLVESMLEEQGSATGTFRIESTGFSGHEKRSLIATFRNANFVSYVWYSKYETFDPSKYGLPLRTQCENYYKTRPGESQCQNNYFITGESVNGPMHTEDHVGICGSPAFGRTPTDRIEFGQLKTELVEPSGYSVEEDTGCSAGAHPNFQGTHILANEVKELQPPPGDEELVHVVEPKYHFYGKTEITLTGKTMTIVEHKGAGFPTEVTKPGEPYPPNGVIYVSSLSCPTYLPFGPAPLYSEDTTCGNVYVNGKYENSLTIAAQTDVIINGNITTPTSPEGTAEGTPTTNALLGLIANNFVRIYHPVEKTYEGKGPELETTGVQLEGAVNKEVIRAEPLESGLKMEVKNSGSEYEIAITNSKSEVLEKTGMLTAASQLLSLSPTPKYIKYTEGTKYTEGSAEKLSKFGARTFGVVKISPKSPYFGKELQVEVEGGVIPTKTMVKVKKEGVVVPGGEKEVENASQLTGSTPYFSYEQNGASHAQGEKEKLRKGVSKWLDETCTGSDQFSSALKLCEYTNNASSCDAPNASGVLKNPIIYAAILALKHAVVVDNYACGATTGLEHLNVYGAVAGLFSNGLTGEFNGSTGLIEHGYPYNANYDNRLQIEEPPHFLNPIQADWYIQRQTLASNP